MRHCAVVVSFSVLIAMGAFTPPAAIAAQAVSGGQLKVDELSALTKGGKVSLVGFAWEGPARLFANDFGPADLAATGAGDRSFSVAAEGSNALCEGLKKLGTEEKTIEQGRLSFRSPDGPLKTLKLEGITVEEVDCLAKPWTADLLAANLEDAPAHSKDRDKTKKKAKKAKTAKEG